MCFAREIGEHLAFHFSHLGDGGSILHWPALFRGRVRRVPIDSVSF